MEQPTSGDKIKEVSGSNYEWVSGEALPMFALTGCLTEAKRGVERLNARSVKFAHCSWMLTLNVLAHHLGHVGPSRPNALYYLPFMFGAEDGTLVPGGGHMTAADLIRLPTKFIDNDALLAKAFIVTARFMDHDGNWERAGDAADVLAEHPGHTLDRGQLFPAFHRHNRTRLPTSPIVGPSKLLVLVDDCRMDE